MGFFGYRLECAGPQLAAILYPAKDLIIDSHPKNGVQDDDDKNADTGCDSNEDNNGEDEDHDKDDNDEVQNDKEEDYEHVLEEDYEHFHDDEGDGYYDDGIIQYICNSLDCEAWDGSMKLPHWELDHSEEEDGIYSPHMQSSLDLGRGDADYLFMMDYLGGYASD